MTESLKEIIPFERSEYKVGEKFTAASNSESPLHVFDKSSARLAEDSAATMEAAEDLS